MLKVTWEWIGIYEPALDIANTVAISNGVEHDLLEPADEYERWAVAAARGSGLPESLAASLPRARPSLVGLRAAIRAVFAAITDGRPIPRAAAAELNRASRAARSWIELSPSGVAIERSDGTTVERLVAVYARSAIQIAAEGADRLRRCAAPSCGMFYRPARQKQQWCSTQCGTRARVARHYRRPRGQRLHHSPQ